MWRTGKGRCSTVTVWCTGKGRRSVVIVWCAGKGRHSTVIVWCVSSCVEERQLRQRIRELTRYRKNGVTKEEGRVFARTHTHIFHRLISINHSVVVLCSYLDCSEFDMLRQEQEKMKENRRQADNDSQ